MNWILWTLLLFMIVFVRYLIFSGGYHYLFRIRLRDRFRHRIFHYEPERGAQVRREIYRSLVVSLIFSAFGVGMLWLWQAGYTKIYLDPNERSYWWLLASPLLFIFAQETYYYWTHRWMHRPGVYEFVHRWHHQSIETTAWTAFSFHPTEAIIQAIFLPAFVLLVPIQAFVFLSLLGIMTLSATINHAGIEVFPSNWARIPILKRLIGATHHDLHHKEARTNYGLYLTYWDEWMGTENKKYKKKRPQGF